MNLGEFDLIQKYVAPLCEGELGAFGLLDDAAVFEPREGYDLVLTKDAMVEGVHFFASDPPRTIAQKLLRVNLSDLAAKGARPLHYLLSCAWPADISEDWLAEFCQGLATDQAEFGLTLLGGDTVSTPGPMVLSLTAMGECLKGKMIKRQGAQPGDLLFVSGDIGTSALGLAVLKGEVPGEPTAFAGSIDRYRRPQPRVYLGMALSGLATAALDVSDGLVADCGHLAGASGVQILLEGGKVPFAPDVRNSIKKGFFTLERVLTGGDDYEICFSIKPDDVDELRLRASKCGAVVSEIGRVEEGSGIKVLDQNNSKMVIKTKGYTHF
jgi:thiamine-monophosphate kinase